MLYHFFTFILFMWLNVTSLLPLFISRGQNRPLTVAVMPESSYVCYEKRILMSKWNTTVVHWKHFEDSRFKTPHIQTVCKSKFWHRIFLKCLFLYKKNPCCPTTTEYKKRKYKYAPRRPPFTKRRQQRFPEHCIRGVHLTGQVCFTSYINQILSYRTGPLLN